MNNRKKKKQKKQENAVSQETEKKSDFEVTMNKLGFEKLKRSETQQERVLRHNNQERKNQGILRTKQFKGITFFIL